MESEVLKLLTHSLERLSTLPSSDFIALTHRVACHDQVFLELDPLGDVRLHYAYGGVPSHECASGLWLSFPLGLDVVPQLLASWLSLGAWSVLCELLEGFEVRYSDGDYSAELSPAGRLAHARFSLMLSEVLGSGALHLSESAADFWRAKACSGQLEFPEASSSARQTLRDPRRVLN